MQGSVCFGYMCNKGIESPCRWSVNTNKIIQLQCSRHLHSLVPGPIFTLAYSIYYIHVYVLVRIRYIIPQNQVYANSKMKL